MKTGNEYYIIKNAEIIGVTPLFHDYINKNFFNAPKIPYGINTINKNTFINVEKLNEIYIPTSIIYLSISTFEKYNDIRINYGDIYEIKIRKKDIYLDYNKMFKLSRTLKKFDAYIENNDKVIDNIPKWVSCIGEFCFQRKSNIEKLILNHDMSIYKQAFSGCRNLKEIIGSNNIRDYGDSAFENCSNLKSINIPTSILNIRNEVFKGCKKLTLNIFDKYNISSEDFYIKGKNLYMNNRHSSFKVLETKKDLFFVNNSNVNKVEKEKFLNNTRFDKYLGYIYKSKLDNFNNIENVYSYYIIKNNLIYDFISKNIEPEYFNNYIKYESLFENVILKKCSCLSNKKTFNNKGEKVKRVTKTQYESLLKMSIISGLFEDNEKIQKKSINLINNYIFKIDGKGKRLLNLNKFSKLFNKIESRNVKYNKEFSEYFLYKKENLVKLIKSLDRNEKDLINIIISKCGISKLKYKHNDIYINSQGLLHDEWIIYKNNNNNKKKNINNNNKSTVLSFIDWSLQLDKDYMPNDNENNIYNIFYKYYSNQDALKKINEIITNSKNIMPYIFVKNKDIKKVKYRFNVANIYVKPIYRTIHCSIINNEHEMESIINSNLKDTKIEIGNYSAEILSKNDIRTALAGCVMGNCANVTSNGCEYLYEAYYSDDCQPFLIFNGEKPIASFRLDLDKEKGNGSINSLEVLPEVRYKYSKKQKDIIIELFESIIIRFIKLYEKNFNQKIKKISMGKLSNCDINEDLEQKYKTILHSVYSKERESCSPSMDNHFLIYDIGRG